MRSPAVPLDAGSPERVPSLHPAVAIGLGGAGGLLAGALLALGTDVVSRLDRADGQSGLIVPFVGGPILLAAGWTMLLLWWRADQRWPVGGLVAVLLGIPWLLLARLLFPTAHQTLGIAGAMAAQVLVMTGVPLVMGIGLAALFAHITRAGVLAGLALALLTPVIQVLPGMLLATFRTGDDSLLAWMVSFLLFSTLPVTLPALVLVTPLLAAMMANRGVARRGTAVLVTGWLVLLLALVGGFVTVARVMAGG